MKKEGGIGFAPSFAKASKGGVSSQATAYGDLDSDYAGFELDQSSRAASSTPHNEASRLPTTHTNGSAVAVESRAYQPQPAPVAKTRRATTATRVGRKPAKADAGDTLQRIADTIE